jgi:GxxExxY protein
MENVLYKEEAYNIIGACYTVYNTIGPGFLEAVYQECLEIELTKQNIPFESQKLLKINYNGILLKQTYSADFLCYDKIILEIKAEKELSKTNEAQVFNYLNATECKLGLLVNFGSYPNLQQKRIVL